MAQSIAFGAYTIHIDGGKLTVLDHNGQLVATADLTADAAAKISLPNGQVLDMGQLADALSSDHIADFATAAGGSGAVGGASSSGMFFHNAQGQGLGGFDEMQVIKSSLETPATAPSTEDQQATFSPETFIALQHTPAGETTPPPSSGQLPVDNTPTHNLPDDNPPADNHASDNAGGSNNQGNNSQGGSHTSDNSGGSDNQGGNSQGGGHASGNNGGNNDQGDNSQGGGHASGNNGGNNDQGDNSQGGSQASDNSGGNNDQGDNSQGDSHASGNSSGNNDQGDNSQGGSHASDNSGGNNDQGDNSQGDSHASDNSGGNNDQGDNAQGGSHASDNSGGNNDQSDNAQAGNHASDNSGGNNDQGDNSQGGSHASDNSGGNNDQGDNAQGGSHASDNSGGNNDQSDNAQGGSHASDNSGGNNDQGDNSQGGSHTSDNSGGNNDQGDNPPADNTQAFNTPVDTAPVAADAAASTKEDVTLHGSVTATDVDGDHLTYSLVNGSQHGTVAFNSDGTYTYTPNADYNGTDSFTYKANDGSLNSNTGTVNLTVTPVNDAPVAANASITTAEDTKVQNHVTATDVDGDHLTYSLVTGPQHGTVTFGSDGNFVYKPLGDYFGNDSFTYQANDGSLSSNVATVALTVTPVDDAPVISADTTVLDHYETLAGASTQSQTFSAQPHVQITDVDSTQMSSATIDTHGFQHGDALHIGSSSLFNVTVSQSGDDYHISIAAKAGSESTTHFQDFINSISFSSTSTHDGTRTLDYTVTDDQHAVSNTAHGAVNIQSSYEVWASQLAPSQNTLGSGDDILHLDSKLTGKFDMGSGDDTVHFEINNGTFNHQTAPNLQNVEHIDTTGYGTNTVSLSISDVLNMTDGGHFLSIVGDKADSVNLTGDNSANHWQQTGSHDGFNVYTWSDPNHAAVVEISQIMHQSAT